MCSISGVRRGRTGALAAAPLRPTCAFRSNRMACVSVDISVIHCPSVVRPRSSFPSRFASVTAVTAVNAVTAPPPRRFEYLRVSVAAAFLRGRLKSVTTSPAGNLPIFIAVDFVFLPPLPPQYYFLV